MCGEKARAIASLQALSGSPPRVRGKVVHIERHDVTNGITPACAGKSTSLAAIRLSIKDHPRVCGEKSEGLNFSTPVSGSPPRVRGKANRENKFPMIVGITPACAGKRPSRVCGEMRSRDHPRVCGEKILAFRLSLTSGGSPPRVRGKAVSSSIALPSSGITPACAGKSQNLLQL